MTVPEQFADAATRCIGARFRLQGRDPSTGLDCVGLVAWCAQTIGLPVMDSNDYVLASSAEKLMPHLLASGFVMRPDLRPRAGDVLIFKLQNSLNHVGICTPRGVVHADMRFRRVVEHRLDAFWQAQLAHVFYIDGQ
jgi:murein DD-endopeptidase / murein LD-carboxypeptidase